ncbi:MAG: lipooligosaccharide transport system, transporter permease component LptG, partial [Pseudomonadota bacterium]
MNLAYKFIVSLYLKRFFTFLAGAEIFFLLIDFLQNQKHLPSGANQVLLYIYYQAIAGLGFTLPLTLCFATISAFATLSKTNEAMALLSLGFSKKRMIAPMALSAFAVMLMHIAIISSDAGRSYDAAQAILKGQNRIFDDGGLMFKFQDSLVTAEGIDWISSEAKGVRIFEFNGTVPSKMIYAAKAHYNNNAWELQNAISLDIPNAQNLDSKAKVSKKEIGNITTLEGFWPKILDNISNSQGIL